MISLAENGAALYHPLQKLFKIDLLTDGLINAVPGMTDCTTGFYRILKLVITGQPMNIVNRPGNSQGYPRPGEQSHDQQTTETSIHAHRYQYPFRGPSPSCGHTPTR